MELHRTNLKSIGHFGRMTALLAAGAALPLCADTVAWWRFNGTGSAVPNVANPGTLDGTIVSYSASGSTVTYGSTAADKPTVSEKLQSIAPRVYDPVSGAVAAGGKTLSWESSNVKGGVKVDITDAIKNFTSFTVEAMIRLPADAANRSDDVFPIIQCGKDKSEGWNFGVYRGYLWSRCYFANSSGELKKIEGSGTTTGLPSLYDGKWHHVAMFFNTSGARAVVRYYVDGVTHGATSASGVWDHWNYSGDWPLFIGANQQSNSRTFYGDIAEVRISRGGATSEFLAPLADGGGLADDDTALLLTFDNTDAIGFASNQVVQPTSGYVWYAKNWNILNAAYNNPVIPVWEPLCENNSPNNTIDELRPQMTGDVDHALTLAVSDGGTATNVLFNGGSIKFTPYKLSTSNGNLSGTDRINLGNAHGLASGAFTVEVVFKTKADAPTSETITFFHSPYLQVMTSGGKFYAIGFGSSFGTRSTVSSGVNVHDGEWHHGVVTYDGTGKIELFVDGESKATLNKTLFTGATASDKCYVGARYDSVWDGGTTAEQVGSEWELDTIRITRRLLSSDEFLFGASRPDRYVDARFDDDTAPVFSTGLPDYLAPAGTGYAQTGGSVPSVVPSRSGKVILDGADGTDTAPWGSALSIANGYVVFPRNRLLETDSLTVEFFAKFSDFSERQQIVSLDWADGSGRYVWNLLRTSYDNKLYIRSHRTENGGVGVSHAQKTICDLANEAQNFTRAFDGKWHHWAITIQPKNGDMHYELFLDHKHGGIDADLSGNLYYPPCGTTLKIFGLNVNSAAIIDNFRITPGVLDPSEFMHTQPFGLMIIFH